MDYRYAPIFSGYQRHWSNRSSLQPHALWKDEIYNKHTQESDLLATMGPPSKEMDFLQCDIFVVCAVHGNRAMGPEKLLHVSHASSVGLVVARSPLLCSSAFHMGYWSHNRLQRRAPHPFPTSWVGHLLLLNALQHQEHVLHNRVQTHAWVLLKMQSRSPPPHFGGKGHVLSVWHCQLHPPHPSPKDTTAPCPTHAP